MTRRKFIRRLMTAASAICVGASWLGRKATPRRFVRAVRTGKYPGVLKPLGDISSPGKWGG
jgi:hypothetical protein